MSIGCYNSLNQVIAQKTPDAGTSKFYYDVLGRLVLSQNAKQAATAGNPHSFTKYDAQGRTVQVGQVSSTGSVAHKMTTALVTSFYNAATNWQQITRTVYDKGHPTVSVGQLGNPPLLAQRHLRSRVAYTQVIGNGGVDEDYYVNHPNEAPAHDMATFYSYDPMGNVQEMIHDYAMLASWSAMTENGQNRFKRIRYKYDLVSGKVNELHYQPPVWNGSSWTYYKDAFVHRYLYDAENRLTDVHTNTDGRNVHWESDAIEAFLLPWRGRSGGGIYKHGPLARTELGGLRVQGMDYAYTLQGWLKGLNSSSTHQYWDMRHDGAWNYSPANDAVGFALDYYNYDFTPIGNWRSFAADDVFEFRPDAHQLFNGNIAVRSLGRMVPGQANPAVNAYSRASVYLYDQLNRIRNVRNYNGPYAFTGNNWEEVTGPLHYAGGAYKEVFDFDPNGNFTAANRQNGQGQTIDDLQYDLLAGTNRLHNVHEKSTSLGNQTGQDMHHQSDYTFDEIGQLKAERIANSFPAPFPWPEHTFQWNVYGKLSYASPSQSYYFYDAQGQRYVESSQATWHNTIYVRDAQGQVLMVYSHQGGMLRQQEVNLYGSSRLGTWNPNRDVTNCMETNLSVTTFTRGQKRYELADHLGNVLATISDKRIGRDDGGDGGGTPNDGLADAWLPDLVTAQEYYVFGGVIADRSYAQGGEQYRYGFNGKENMDNVAGAGNFLDYGLRSYDPRIGRFTSVDPLAGSYPFYTPYQYAGNNPVSNTDLDGAEPEDFKENWKYPAFGNLTTMKDERDIDGSLSVVDPKLGKIDVMMVFDKVTKTNWFVHQDQSSGNYFYYKPTAANGNASEMSVVPNSSFEGGYKLTKGSFVEFKTQNHKQAILGKNLANGMATSVFALAALGTGGFAVMEGGGAFFVNQASRYIVNSRYADNTERLISAAANLVGQYLQNIPQNGYGAENLSNINVTQVGLSALNPSSVVTNAVVGNTTKATLGTGLDESIVGSNFNAKDAMVGGIIDGATGGYGRGIGKMFGKAGARTTEQAIMSSAITNALSALSNAVYNEGKKTSK